MNDDDIEIEYFYTTHTPCAWSSGPVVHDWNLTTNTKITSMAEARELALAARRGPVGSERWIATTFGCRAKTPDLE